MTGLNLSQFKSLIVRPALAGARLGGEAAVNLLTGTCLVESGLSWLEQIKGPALGIAQMEPATHDDCWVNYLRYQQDTANHILATCGLSGLPDASVMDPSAPLNTPLCGTAARENMAMGVQNYPQPLSSGNSCVQNACFDTQTGTYIASDGTKRVCR